MVFYIIRPTSVGRVAFVIWLFSFVNRTFFLWAAVGLSLRIRVRIDQGSHYVR